MILRANLFLKERSSRAFSSPGAQADVCMCVCADVMYAFSSQGATDFLLSLSLSLSLFLSFFLSLSLSLFLSLSLSFSLSYACADMMCAFSSAGATESSILAMCRQDE